MINRISIRLQEQTEKSLIEFKSTSREKKFLLDLNTKGQQQ